MSHSHRVVLLQIGLVWVRSYPVRVPGCLTFAQCSDIASALRTRVEELSPVTCVESDFGDMFIIGQSVITPYGAGVVTKVRENDVVVQPHAYWRLAEDTIPTFFMNPKDVTPAPPTAEEKVAKAKEMKTEAMTLFKAGNHTAARVAYTQAQEAIAQMPAGISDQCNAERFEITVTCANNIALCSFFLKDAQECFSSAQNSFRLVEALEGQISKGTSKVFEAICTIGTVKSVDDLRKTWKRKSVYFMGQAHVLKKDHKSAIQFFQEALALLGDDANFAKDATTISTKISQAKKYVLTSIQLLQLLLHSHHHTTLRHSC